MCMHVVFLWALMCVLYVRVSVCTPQTGTYFFTSTPMMGAEPSALSSRSMEELETDCMRAEVAPASAPGEL